MTRVSPVAKAVRYTVASAVALGLLAGCAGSASKHMARAGDHAVRSNAKQSGAIAAAEKAVALSPNDAAARLALGQAYLDAGRFQSAATSFSDAIELGDASGRTQLSLALSHVGAGNNSAAVTVLNDARDTIPATDRGLALALAGDTDRGVAILVDAVRGGENTAKLRQNLAFAYALNGSWRESRIAMAQDLPGDQIDDRISQWALMSGPESVQKRIATLLSVPAGVEDPGQPQALALGAPAPAEQFAVAAPAAPTAELPAIAEAPMPAPSVAAPALAAAEPAPTAVSPAFAAAFAAPQPEARPGYAARPVVQPVPVVEAKSYARVAPVKAAAFQPAVVPVTGGKHVVQLGAFSSEANAKRAIGVFTARSPELRGYSLTITPAVVNGRNFWRVAATGFDMGGARSLCSGLKTRGNACFAYAADRAPVGLPRPAFALAGAKARR